ncbi:HD domain-containing protein [Spirochaeta dissipatitropha]
MNLLQQLRQLPVPVYLSGHSAIRHYLKLPPGGFADISIVGGLVEIARCFESVYYPQIEGYEAAADFHGHTLLIRCLDSHPDPQTRPGHTDLDNWNYDLKADSFIDTGNVYERIRQNVIEGGIESDIDFFRHAIGLSRIPLSISGELEKSITAHAGVTNPGPDALRTLLSSLVTGEQAFRSLGLLHQAGFIQKIWPELGMLDDQEQGKSEHPEGNVWQHSLEALKYRKSFDLRVSLAILMHDIGKPHAEQTQEHRFHLHADIGAGIAGRLLRAMNYPDDIVADTMWLIRYHSIPGALERLPTHRSAPLMSHQLFPLLLELYRCDLSSTWRGPENYYRACTVYRRFLKNHNNPFRTAEGKKLVNSLVD